MPDPLRGGPGRRLPVKMHKQVCLILTEDAVLAEELLARKQLARDVVGRLNERALLIRPGRAEAVIAELGKMGQTPQVAGPIPSSNGNDQTTRPVGSQEGM